jgi:hypothetical protein
VIRQAQMQAFAQENRRAYSLELVQFFLKHYPRECRQAGGESQILAFVEQGLEEAESFGMTTRRELRLFAVLRMMLGSSWTEDPQIPWAGIAMQDPDMSNATARIEGVFSQAVDYLHQIAGSKSEIMVRALIRIRDFDTATLPPMVTETWPDFLSALWIRLYPEKWQVQGKDIGMEMIRLGQIKAKAYGLQDGLGVYIYSTLLFLLGSGFDRDLLHPWAKMALTDPNLRTGQERGIRLYRMAMSHLNQSLTAG